MADKSEQDCSKQNAVGFVVITGFEKSKIIGKKESKEISVIHLWLASAYCQRNGQESINEPNTENYVGESCKLTATRNIG